MASFTGRVVGGTIELDSVAPELEGMRVRVTVEPVDDPVARAFRDAPLDDRPFSEEERAGIERARNGRFSTTEELRAKLAQRRRGDE